MNIYEPYLSGVYSVAIVQYCKVFLLFFSTPVCIKKDKNWNVKYVFNCAKNHKQRQKETL